jgi:hypothetical protein
MGVLTSNQIAMRLRPVRRPADTHTHRGKFRPSPKKIQRTVSKDRLPGSKRVGMMQRWRRGHKEYSFLVGHPFDLNWWFGAGQAQLCWQLEAG